MKNPIDEIQRLLISLYGSTKPQPFTQIHVAYNSDKHTINTTMKRVYDLRAGAPVQILFANGISKDRAIEYLQCAIREIEISGIMEGLPDSVPNGLLPSEIREQLNLDLDATNWIA